MKCPGHGTATLAKACSRGFRGGYITARAPEFGLVDIAGATLSDKRRSECVVHFDAVMFKGYVMLRECVSMRALLFQWYTTVWLREECIHFWSVRMPSPVLLDDWFDSY